MVLERHPIRSTALHNIIRAGFQVHSIICLALLQLLNASCRELCVKLTIFGMLGIITLAALVPVAVAQDVITQEQLDELKAARAKHGKGRKGAKLESVASAIGVSVDDLRSDAEFMRTRPRHLPRPV